jgi:hypothetical protein
MRCGEEKGREQERRKRKGRNIDVDLAPKVVHR